MVKRLTTSEFIQRSIAVHGLRYNYSKTVFVNSVTKVIVTCRRHGDWLVSPHNHTSSKRGCPKCGDIQRSIKRTKPWAGVLQDMKNVHGDLYEYDESTYVNTNKPMTVICKKHGAFNMRPNSHITQQQGCPICVGKGQTTQRYIDDFRVVHGDKYDYSRVEVFGSHDKVQIGCRSHGVFYQTPALHKFGQGCPRCAYGNHKGRYSDLFFERHPEKKDVAATVYVLDGSNTNEHFIKVGITTTSVQQRIRNNKTTTYKLSIIHQHKCTLYEAFILERQTLDFFHRNRYNPKEHFQGNTECLSADITNNVLNFLKDKIK